MDGTLREESGLVCLDLVEDESGTILRDHSRDERAIGDIIELCRSRVGVRGVHAAWTDETDSWETLDRCVSAGQEQGTKVSRTDRDIVPDGSGHSDGIGRGAESACADGPSNERVHKIELERLVRKEVGPLGVGRGFQQFRDELGVILRLSGNGGESDCGKGEKPP